jgi:hypothetical protein
LDSVRTPHRADHSAWSSSVVSSFSQLVTLFVTPVIYLWLEWFQEHVLDKVPFLRSKHNAS